MFSDVGIDDAITFIYGHLNPKIEIVGVVADYGNVSRNNAISSIDYLFKAFEMPLTIPIISGAVSPMTAEQPTFYPEIHGVRGLGPIIAEENRLIPENFFEIVSIIEEYKNDLIIVNIGRLTSLATMFILYEELMADVKGFYIMGGAFLMPGNISPVAEANFYGDPVAVEIVLSKAENVTILPLNATEKAIVTPEMVDYIDAFHQTDIFKILMDFYTEFYQKRDPTLSGSPIHDTLTLIAVIHPEMFTFASYPIDVERALKGMTRGQSIVDLRTYEESTNNKKSHRIAFDLDYEQFFYNFLSVMTSQTLKQNRQ